eukprot:scaffold3058_cov232-Pinguiococcus_pyrenoidosus.AAC.5
MGQPLEPERHAVEGKRSCAWSSTSKPLRPTKPRQRVSPIGRSLGRSERLRDDGGGPLRADGQAAAIDGFHPPVRPGAPGARVGCGGKQARGMQPARNPWLTTLLDERAIGPEAQLWSDCSG